MKKLLKIKLGTEDYDLEYVRVLNIFLENVISPGSF